MARFWSILTLATLAQASPSAFLPINAQVPPVARAGQPYGFQFAQSTFTSSVGFISYALTNSPEWLQLDGNSRTFSGTPSNSDIGSFVVELVATDGSGSTTMPVTFFISTSNGPGLGFSVADQLSAHNGFSSPDSLLLPHSTSLSLSFSSDTFTNTNVNTIYYALCANNTPLPSWLKFDPNDLSFIGTAPSATSFAELPTTYTISMTATDVAGFAEAIARFSIVVESHAFAFGSSDQIINATAGYPLQYDRLMDNLALNGQPVNSSAIRSASAATPSWLLLDSKTLTLSGTPPEGALPQNVTINATDIYGDTASTTVWIQTTSQNSTIELLGPVATLTVNNGSDFIYDLNRTLTNENATVTVHLGDAYTWLTFDSGTLELKGQVPSNSIPQQYMINVTASLGTQSQSQVLLIQVQASQASAGTTGNAGTLGGAHSNDDSSSAAAASNNGLLHDKRWIALPVVLPVAILLTSLILFCCCCRRRKQETKCEWDCSDNSSDYHVPGPPPREKEPGQEEAAIMSGALHSGSKRNSVRISRPPIIDLPGVWKSYTDKRKSQFRTSQVSANGGGRASRADSWHNYTLNFNVRPQSTLMGRTGAASAVEHSRKKDPSNRYKMRSDFPRFSVSSRSSPTHGYTRNQQGRSNMSFGSSAAFSSGTSGFGLGHGRSIPSQSSAGVLFGTRGVGHGDGGGPPGYGSVRDSWRNFRILRLRGVDGGSSTEGEVIACKNSMHRAMRSDSPERFSIRPVRSNSHHHKKSSDLRRRSTIQTLPTVKSTTTNFRRYNPNAPSDPLQEFHRRRLLLRNTSRVLFTAGTSQSSRKSSHYTSSLPRTPSKSKLAQRGNIGILPTTPEHRAHHHRDRRHSHAESFSSSVMSPLHSSPPRSTRASPKHPLHSRHNTYSTNPGIRLPLIGRGGNRKDSIISDDQDSRWESASSDAQSMDPYMYSREINNGHRETSLFDTQQKGFGTGKSRASSIHGVERFARGLKGLSWQRAEREGNHSDEDDEEDEERGRGRGRIRVGWEEKGKISARSAGMPKGEPGNMSFRGDIRGPDDDGASAFV